MTRVLLLGLLLATRAFGALYYPPQCIGPPTATNALCISADGIVFVQRTLDSTYFTVGSSTITGGPNMTMLGSCIGETSDWCGTVDLTGVTTFKVPASGIVMQGSSSGTLTQVTSAAVTSYTLTWPAAVTAGLIKTNGSGTISFAAATASDFGTQSANTGLLGPTGGSAATPTFRLLDPNDLENIVTTRGDLITRGASHGTRLAVGSANTALISNGTDPSWNLLGASNFNTQSANTSLRGPTGGSAATPTFRTEDPNDLDSILTTRGDIIVRGASHSARFAVGASGTVLVGGTDPAWSGSPTLSGTLTIQGGTLTMGTAGTANTITLGQGTSGTDSSTLTVRSGSNAAAFPIIQLDRGGVDYWRILHDGTDLYMDNNGKWNFRNTFAGNTVFQLAALGSVSRYTNIATAGLGVAPIYQETITGTQTNAGVTVFSYSPPSTAGRYRVAAVITTTSGTNTGTLQCTLDYKDSQGTTHTADIIPILGAAGTFGTTQTSAASKEFHCVPWEFSINNGGTAIALKVVITGSVAYTVAGVLEQLA